MVEVLNSATCTVIDVLLIVSHVGISHSVVHVLEFLVSFEVRIAQIWHHHNALLVFTTGSFLDFRERRKLRVLESTLAFE